MSAKEYARLMREELYKKNKSVLEVTDDLWLAIADNMEKFAEQAVEECKNNIIKNLEERIERYKSLNPDDEIIDVSIKETQRIIEIVKSGGVSDEK